MRTVAVGITLACCVGFVAAEGEIPLERAKKAAEMLAREAKKLTEMQVKTEVDTEKPFGLKKGELAALVIPDKGLTAERLEKVGKDVVPVGQLWLQGLSPITGDSATANDKLRLVKITAKDGDHELPLLLLGVRKGAKGKPELVVYAKGKEPLLVLPLEAGDRNQDQPIELEGKGEGEKGALVLHVVGKYQTKLPVARQAP